MQPHYTSIAFSLIALAAGLGLLVAGGELLVSGAVKLAGRWGMSPLLIGLTVVAFGTSTPELFVSLSANLQGQPDILVGNVIGSNIANIGLILACCALITPIRAPFSFFATELAWVLTASLVLVGLTFYGSFGRIPGILFICALGLFTYSTYKNGSAQPAEEDAPPQSSYLTSISLCLAGFAGLGYGSTLFINGAVDLALFFNIPSLIIGLSIAAIGTSLPELASSVSAIRRGESALLLGNVIGSNLFNLLMVMGTAAIVKPFALQPQLLIRDLPVMILFSAVLVPMFYYGNKIKRIHGFLLLLGYVGYILLLKP
ncbi:MAG: calcium/sodium antiporter [Desulfobulbaceae bacterium]|uniref:Calcium/sodium antiporter n=1 Tax=Candidatus Desulfobia pelagia TaxID=2841692 RepID=A0A8J6NH14_9BACT|nr:calcium/sodium antiporter [Candidatus Desulfobia pelagia]